MTTFPTNFVLSLSALDPSFEGTPEEFAVHLVDRVEVRTTALWYGVSIVSSLPVANVGPVLLNGTQLYVWDEGESTYKPLDITPSLDVEPADKWVLVSDAGTWSWKKISDFWSWSTLSIGNLTPGAAGTIAYSDGTTNQWGTPSVALPAKSVPTTKLVGDVADTGRYLQVQADGTVVPKETATARGAVKETAEADVPADGSGATIDIPDGGAAVAIKVRLVAKATPLFTSAPAGDYGWVIGEEVDPAAFSTDSGSGARIPSFHFIEQPTKWLLFRQHDLGGVGTVQLGRRDVANQPPVNIDPSKWAWKVYYF